MKIGIRKTKSLQQEAASPANSAWVEASAGTGKTKVLTDRILRLLLDGTPAANILCLTFTRSAAAEMEERLRERLLSWTTMPDASLRKDLKNLDDKLKGPDHCEKARQLYDQTLEIEEWPKFHTIHSFCESLLRRFPEEAGVDSYFTVLDEPSSTTLLNSAKDSVLHRVQHGPKSNLKEAINLVSKYTDSEGFSALLAFLISHRSQLIRLLVGNSSRKIARGLQKKLNLEDNTPEFTILKSACKSSSINSKGLRSSINSLSNGTKTDKKRAQEILDWISSPQYKRVEGFEKYRTAFITLSHQPIKRLVSNGVDLNFPNVKPVLEAEQSRLLEVTALLKRTRVADCTKALLALSKEIFAQFEHDKVSLNCLDYDDLIIRARETLHAASTSSWVLYRLDNSIDHVLIDEAQDTSPEQWEIIKAVVSEFFVGLGPRSLFRTIFAVGDYKQSIYSFQRAEPDAFRQMRKYFRSQAISVSAPWSDINLQLSFRSAAPILQAVDSVFQNSSFISNGIKNKEILDTKHHCWRSRAPGLVELWPVIKPKKQRERASWNLPTGVSRKYSSRRQLARLIAKKISALLADKLGTNPVRFKPNDIMVLVRRRGEFVTDLLSELQARQVPVAGVDRVILTDNLAVMDLLSLGHFLLNTNDDLSLAEVLKSPLCNFCDNDLFDIAHKRDNSLWSSLCQSNSTKALFKQAKLFLQTLLEKVTVLTPYELFANLLIADGGRESFIARMGRESIDPMDEFLNRAIEYESKHTESLEGFIHWVENNHSIVRREAAQSDEDAVRILTVHGAKGLEAPVVFLPDTVHKSRQTTPILWPNSEVYPLWIPTVSLLDPLTQNWNTLKKKKDQEEYQRLLYVAMTRAKDQLYICGWSETPSIPDDCWHNMVSLHWGEDGGDICRTFPDCGQSDETLQITRITNFPLARAEKISSPYCSNNFTLLPSWATPISRNARPTSYPKVPSTISPSSLSHITETRTGKLIAHLVDFMGDTPVTDRGPAADRFIAGLSQELNFNLRQIIKNCSLKILASPSLAFLFEDTSLGCLPISGRVKNGAPSATIFSSIDRLIFRDSFIILVKFIAEHRSSSGLQVIKESVSEEIAINAALAKPLFPEKHITSAVLWTDEQRLESVSDDLLKKWAS
jgi:ATP-dependent helicase/nuclease subunit A